MVTRTKEMFESVNHRDEGVNGQRECEGPEEIFDAVDPLFHTLDCADNDQPERLHFTQDMEACDSQCISLACSEDHGSAHRQSHPLTRR